MDIRLYNDCFVNDEPDINYDVIYLRDPFNANTLFLRSLDQIVANIRDKYPGAYFVDNIKSSKDLFFEDKWLQYQVLHKYMVDTKPLQQGEVVGDSRLIKKRISSRGKDVKFFLDKLPEVYEDYIVQSKINITEEYRVFVIGQKIVPTISVRAPKTHFSRLATKRLEVIANDVDLYAQAIAAELPAYDFIGLDIARTPQGLFLIEVNRSPQFNKYNRLSGKNLATKVIDYVDGKVLKVGKHTAY